MNDLLARLCERRRVHFGVFSLLVVLGLAVYLTTRTVFWQTGERTTAVSVVGFLPDSILASWALSEVARISFFVGAVLWVLHVGLPWSSWLAGLSFTLHVALYQENSTYVDHIFQVVNVTLLIYCLWAHIAARAMNAALRRGQFWREPLYPAWVSALAIANIALMFSLSGAAKLAAAGPTWANGVSLQLWAHLDAAPGAARDLLIEHRWAAQVAQALTLVIEVGALIAAAWRPTRIAWAVALGLMLVGVYALFGWRFHLTAVVVAVFFLPVDRVIDRVVAPRQSSAPERLIVPPGWRGRLARGWIARTDVFGRQIFGP